MKCSPKSLLRVSTSSTMVVNLQSITKVKMRSIQTKSPIKKKKIIILIITHAFMSIQMKISMNKFGINDNAKANFFFSNSSLYFSSFISLSWISENLWGSFALCMTCQKGVKLAKGNASWSQQIKGCGCLAFLCLQARDPSGHADNPSTPSLTSLVPL